MRSRPRCGLVVSGKQPPQDCCQLALRHPYILKECRAVPAAQRLNGGVLDPCECRCGRRPNPKTMTSKLALWEAHYCEDLPKLCHKPRLGYDGHPGPYKEWTWVTPSLPCVVYDGHHRADCRVSAAHHDVESGTELVALRALEMYLHHRGLLVAVHRHIAPRELCRGTKCCGVWEEFP